MKMYSCIGEMHPQVPPSSSFTTMVDNNSSRVTEASANWPIGRVSGNSCILRLTYEVAF